MSRHLRAATILRAGSLVASFVVAALGSLLGGPSARAAKIAWVSFHAGDTMPSAAITALGITTAPDKGYTDLLQNAGHMITRVQVNADASVTADLATQLSTFDLVIISRSAGSGQFDSDAESAIWSSITAPMMLQSGYVLRNSRLGYTSGATIPDSNSQFKLKTTMPNHPIFSGIALDGSGVMVDPYTTGPPTFNARVQRGISVNTDPLTGGGTLIASVGTTDPANSGTGMIIAEWPAGAQLPSTIGTHTQAGKRLVFLTGGRETDTVTADSAGVFDLSPTGSQVYLNAVAYLGGPGFKAGDVDADGDVDIADFNAIRDHFQQSAASRALGDLTADGVVDWRDYRQWKSNFAGAANVTGIPAPEPASGVLLGLAAIAWVGGRRRTSPSPR